ncbi:MAG: subclass B1 metallo-beta-lactamase [Pseudomonadota bacterium]
MRTKTALALFATVLTAPLGCAQLQTSPSSAAPDASPSAAASAAPVAKTAEEAEHRAPVLEAIADGVWVHQSWTMIKPWGLILSQGLVIETSDGAVLVDTAWNDADTDDLARLVREETGMALRAGVVTHAHDDKMGGVGALTRVGVPTYAHPMSNEDAPARGLMPAAHTLALGAIGDAVSINDVLGVTGDDAPVITAFYPGTGHTRDNIVVHVKTTDGADIIFGGCLIRPRGAGSLGNTADGDVPHWAVAARLVAERFPDATIVVPSHGKTGGRDLLTRTVTLGRAAAEKQK